MCKILFMSYALLFFKLQVTYQTATGQTLDLITQPGNNFENFTIERYEIQNSFDVQYTLNYHLSHLSLTKQTRI